MNTMNDKKTRHDEDDDTPQPPTCLGKRKGQQIINDGVVWEWTGEYWKQVL